mgnify:CR=1 FL=1
MKVNLLKESTEKASVSSYPLAKYNFETFNPVQSTLLSVYNKNENCIVATSTGSGKTVCSELFIAHTVRVQKKKAIFLSPLKALSQQVYDDWTSEDHHFNDLKIAIFTGDYRLTEARKAELNEANILIFTSEMLNSLARNYFSDKNQFLNEVGIAVFDESHSIGSPDRGTHIESGIMKFTEFNKDARLVLLSATMPNVSDIAKWISKLNEKDTNLLVSSYRPCKLNIHYEKYWNLFSYSENEEQKVQAAITKVKKYPNDKFICFIHSKKTGEILKTKLEDHGIKTKFHNANLTKDERSKVEKEFKSNEGVRVIIATSTLAQGLNLPARRVIIVGVHRGIQEVETSEIIQMCGRSGRPGFDDEGDAYILVPSKTYTETVERLKQPTYITSKMLDNKTMAFHLVSEIHHGYIKNTDDVHKWFERSLAHFQNMEIDEKIVHQVIKGLLASGCIKEEEGEFSVTPVGMVASMFYYSPYDASDLNRNFIKLFDNDLEKEDMAVCFALANTDSNRQGIVSATEKEELNPFLMKFPKEIERAISPKHEVPVGVYKAAFAYYNLMNGKFSTNFINIMNTLKMDFGRTSEVLSTLNQMSSKLTDKEYFKEIALRIQYGVEPHLISLCKVPNIGAVKAKKLFSFGISSPEQMNDSVRVIKALGCSEKVALKLIQEAKKVS